MVTMEAMEAMEAMETLEARGNGRGAIRVIERQAIGNKPTRNQREKHVTSSALVPSILFRQDLLQGPELNSNFNAETNGKEWKNGGQRR